MRHLSHHYFQNICFIFTSLKPMVTKHLQRHLHLRRRRLQKRLRRHHATFLRKKVYLYYLLLTAVEQAKPAKVLIG